MKKIIAAVALCTVCAFGLTGCNKSIIDTHYTFRYAVLQRYDGEELIEIASWKDFDDGDQVQFTSTDGITYLVHSSQVILLSDREH